MISKKKIAAIGASWSAPHCGLAGVAPRAAGQPDVAREMLTGVV